MKRTTMIAFLVLGLLFPGLVRAHGHGKTDIKLFKESAAALEATNPDLAGRLRQCAAGEKKEGVETAEAEKKDAELFREAATELKASHPDLAKRLNRVADKETRESSERRPRVKSETPPTGY